MIFSYTYLPVRAYHNFLKKRSWGGCGHLLYSLSYCSSVEERYSIGTNTPPYTMSTIMHSGAFIVYSSTVQRVYRLSYTVRILIN